MGRIFSQNSVFFQHDVVLDDAVGQKQLVSMTKDRNGYYWMLTASHKILKWDGRNFTRMDSLPAYKLSLKDYWFKIYYDSQGNPYFSQPGKITLCIDENSQLKIVGQESGYEKQMHVNGPYYSFTRSRDAIKKMNNVTGFDQFYKAYTDYDNSSIFGVDADKFYVGSYDGIYYYNNGAVSKVRDKGVFSGSVFFIGGSLVVLLQNGNYEVYTTGGLVASGTIRQAGFSQSFHRVKASRVVNWWLQTQTTDSSAMFASGECIYSLTLSNNTPVLTKYFVIPGDQKYIDFYCDLEKERVFLIDPRGGFSYFERNPVFTFPYRESLATGVIHSINNLPDGVLRSNRDYQHRLNIDFEKISPLESISPIIYHKGRNYYFVDNTAFVINSAGQVEEKIPIPEGGNQIFAAAATDSVVFFQNGNLYALHNNSGTTGIRELPFYDNGIKIRIDYIEKGGDDALFASSKTNGHIYELNVKQLSAKRISRLPISKCRSICYDRQKNLLLIATHGNGPVILSLADGRQIDLPMDANSSLLSCHYLLTDRDGDWWLPTNAGLFYLSAADLAQYVAGKMQTLAYRQIEKEFNVPSLEYNGSFSTSGFMSGDSAFFSSP